MCRKPIYLMLFAAVLYVAATAGAAGSLVAHWALDDGAGTTAADSSGNGHDGTVGGEATWIDGAIDGALDFDGTSTHINMDDEVARGTFTLTLWLRPRDIPYSSDYYAVLHDDAWDSGSVHVHLRNTTSLFNVDINGGGAVTSTTVLQEGEWYHFAAALDVASENNLYVNGVLEATTGAGSTPYLGPLNFGAWNDGTTRFYHGAMDDIRVYNRVLKEGQVNDVMNGLAPDFSKAEEPNPPDGAVGVSQPLLQWAAGEGGIFHDVYLGTSPDLTAADLVAPRQPFTMYYHVMGLEPGVTYYWRIDEIQADMVTITTGDVWSFTMLPLTAWAPTPGDGAEQVLLSPMLAWTPGQAATEHHLYFGADRAAVEAGAAEADMGALPVSETTYQVAGPLDLETTYFWRVDETAFGGEVRTGEVWSFTTIAPGPGGAIRQWWLGVTGTDVATLTGDARYPDEPDGQELVALMEGPIDWAENYGSRLYGWLYPSVSGDYTFWISSDDGGELRLSPDADPANAVPIASVATYTGSREWGKEAVQVSTPQSLVAGQVYYIEALMNEGGGGDNIAVAWQGPDTPFGVIGSDVIGPTSVYPLRAYAPSPADGAMDTIQSPILSWSPGQGATQHAVYLGDDADAVANADTSTADIFRGQQAGTSYGTGPLEWGKTYYWRVDENSAAEPGKVWSFTTANFLNIEDFEVYNDDIEGGTTVYQTWTDGWENGTTSTVGYLEAQNGTFCETTIVYSGGQSMPLDANNVNAPYYGETSKTFTPAMNMTANGMDTLTLYVRGQGTNDAIPLYIGLKSGATRVNVLVADDAIAQAGSWVEVNIPLADFAPVNPAAVNEMFISLGNPDAPTPGGTALIFVDAIRVTKPAAAE